MKLKYKSTKKQILKTVENTVDLHLITSVDCTSLYMFVYSNFDVVDDAIYGPISAIINIHVNEKLK